ncbi:Predicted O-methyltransferase YrrM [Verrucomicrobium sp. GAS474]|uniref:O-methyltransferase n=1 Tax=Verrucomicrobium sp. GAS474 TaxID=1882831 RepID=UPI00087D90E4|nr:class I SAM-dependent methyltransferase [Verrucomicrobium sp. GAS474]SDT95785.1 Predicted O-methyltransferase YrrM [Verrucomicrobium sp. GAS474]
MISLPPQVETVLRAMAQEGATHDTAETAHARKRLNLEWPTAETLFVAVRLARRRRILEIGTSNGFSTIWLASAIAQQEEGELISIERHAEKSAQAAHNLKKAGLSRWVTLLQGEATPVVAELEGTFDCVFFDADRVTAKDQFASLLPRLTPDALLLADNVLSHPHEIAGYLECVEESGHFDCVTLPVGKGLHLAMRRPLVIPDNPAPE